MISTTIKWNGDKAIVDIEKATIKSLTEGALLIQGRAASLSPVDTGLLRSSITYVIHGKPKDFPDAIQEGDKFVFGNNQTITAPKGTAIIGTVVFYGPYVEFGTRYMKAQPYLIPAYLKSLNDIKNLFSRNYRSVRWIK